MYGLDVMPISTRLPVKLLIRLIGGLSCKNMIHTVSELLSQIAVGSDQVRSIAPMLS